MEKIGKDVAKELARLKLIISKLYEGMKSRQGEQIIRDEGYNCVDGIARELGLELPVLKFPPNMVNFASNEACKDKRCERMDAALTLDASRLARRIHAKFYSKEPRILYVIGKACRETLAEIKQTANN